MRVRRSHRKSRFGCKRCKMRRMKCDEIHPACGNCVRHSVLCDFTQTECSAITKILEPVMIPSLPRTLDRGSSSLKTSSTVSRTISPSGSQSSLRLLSNSSPSTALSSCLPPSTRHKSQEVNQQFEVFQLPYPSPIPTPSDRLLELKLYHHYIQMIPSTNQPYLDGSLTGLQSIWKEWVTSLAINDNTLMDAILGFSASHLRVINPSDRAVSQASDKYMLRAITSHAEQLRRGVDSQNVEVLFATSTFMALYSCMNPSGEVRGPPLHWFRPFQGTRAIAEAGWNQFQNSDIRQFLVLDLNPRKALLDQLQLRQIGHEFAFDFLLDGLRLDEDDAETYQHAVAYLNMLHKKYLPRYILRFPALVSRRFVVLLAAEDPRTLTIVGYFFMLLRRFSALWWTQSQSEAQFRELMDLIPGEWLPRMDWAVREFEQANINPESVSEHIIERGECGRSN